MLRHGADINTVDADGDTPLHEAAIHGCIDAVKELLGHLEINITHKNKQGLSAYQLAVRSGRPNTASVIRAELNRRLELCCIIISSDNPQEEIRKMRSLIAAGADVNARYEDGATPIHIAARLGTPDIVRCLVRNGADVNAKDKYGDTARDDAKTVGHAEIKHLIRDTYGGKKGRSDCLVM